MRYGVTLDHVEYEQVYDVSNRHRQYNGTKEGGALPLRDLRQNNRGVLDPLPYEVRPDN